MTVPHPDQPLALLGGLTPAQFMKRWWQRKPLLIRQAIPGFKPPIGVTELKRMARRDDVASRLIWRENGQWQMEHGPFARLPKAAEPDWTLLVQSVDLHSDAATELMHRFRFVPDARLDDVMVSIATDGGGVGPHFDSYDVFLLQAVGRREWRIGRQRDLSLQPDLPLKILRRFEPEETYILEPGDMLYLPPQVAHDGIAQGDCMTISIGFRAPDQATLARGMLEAAAEQVLARAGLPSGPYGEPALPGPRLDARYRDPGQAATTHPAELPDGLIGAALQAVGRIRFDETLAHRFLGCWLTEPGAQAVFDPTPADGPDLQARWPDTGLLKLDRRTRMLYRGRQLFINGETAPVPASAVLRRLADDRYLACDARTGLSLNDAERDCLTQWLDDGWLHYIP
ncbi:ribosomal protein uL16 3-hydroxylase [Bordetella genomosp. 9]|uniref:Cupin n=1 Tax=Bordetella genomosp. 9 TaxID=1416803 RepID=A0A1W6Z2C2_9BORD|nr:cupin domain-containing protein [Bordetella genomosp. 9]ARP87468.1 cupin [Bordetella genomosp. 9]